MHQLEIRRRRHLRQRRFYRLNRFTNIQNKINDRALFEEVSVLFIFILASKTYIIKKICENIKLPNKDTDKVPYKRVTYFDSSCLL